MTGCQSLHVVNHDVIGCLQSINLNDSLDLFVPALVRLLFLYTVAKIVRSLLKLELAWHDRSLTLIRFVAKLCNSCIILMR